MNTLKRTPNDRAIEVGMGESCTESKNCLEAIPPDLRSIFEPQLTQLGANVFDVPYGVAAHLDSAMASGWFWACVPYDDCLVTTMHMVAHRSFVLREVPEVDYYVLGLLSSSDTGLVSAMRKERTKADRSGDPFAGGFPPTLQRNALAFSMQRGLREFKMPAGSLHDSCNVCMLPTFLDRVSNRMGDSASCLRTCFEEGADLNASERLLQTMHAFSPTDASRLGAPLHYQALVLEALAEVASFLHERARGRQRVDLRPDDRIADAVSAALLTSLANPPSLDELSDRLYLGRTRLCQRFREETGMSIGEMLTQLRVSEAKRRLERGTESIAEIAHALGYAHASSFSTMFAREVGVSPHAWREDHGH